MGMLFLSATDPHHKLASKWRVVSSASPPPSPSHQPTSGGGGGGGDRSPATSHNNNSSSPKSSLSFPYSAPDLTMTVASSSSNSHSHNLSHTNSHRRKKRTSQFLLFLGCLVLVLFLLRKDERRVVVLVKDVSYRDDDSSSSNNNNAYHRIRTDKNTKKEKAKAGTGVLTSNRTATTKDQSKAVRGSTTSGSGSGSGSNRTKATGGDETLKPKPIRQISILGERNSGTRWTYDHMHKCFGHAVHVTKRFTRYKHWFQYPNPTKYPHDTLVLAQFRNPYDWLKAMEHVPHHSPNHIRTKKGATVHDESAVNDWKEFLTKKWTMERVGADLLLDPNNATCQEDFHYRDIVSCVMEPLPPSYYNWTQRYSEHQPFYEMRNDGSGVPYDNILQLRTDKIRNFMSTANYPGVADLWVIQYEYLLSSGTGHLVDKVAELTGVKPLCDAIPPQNRKQKKSRYISPEFAAHVRKHLNWTVESWIGYEVDLQREEDQAW